MPVKSLNTAQIAVMTWGTRRGRSIRREVTNTPCMEQILFWEIFTIPANKLKPNLHQELFQKKKKNYGPTFRVKNFRGSSTNYIFSTLESLLVLHLLIVSLY